MADWGVFQVCRSLLGCEVANWVVTWFIGMCSGLCRCEMDSCGLKWLIAVQMVIWGTNWLIVVLFCYLLCELANSGVNLLLAA